MPTIKSARLGQRERGVEKLGRGGHEEEGTVAPPLLEVLGGYPQVYEPGDERERRGRVQARPAAIGGEASHGGHPRSLALGVPTLAAGRRRAARRVGEGDHQANDSQRQVQQIVEDRVAVGDEAEHHGHHEAQDADEQVDDA